LVPREPHPVTVITASEIIGGLWSILNIQSPNKRGLRGSQVAALKELLDVRGGKEFIANRPQSEVEGLLHDAWESARKNLKKTRKNLRNQGLATALVMIILHGPSFAGRTGEERRFYWDHGYWPDPCVTSPRSETLLALDPVTCSINTIENQPKSRSKIR
jgi:hypothetical protein